MYTLQCISLFSTPFLLFRTLLKLGSLLWSSNIPLLVCRSYGFIGCMRIVLQEHCGKLRINLNTVRAVVLSRIIVDDVTVSTKQSNFRLFILQCFHSNPDAAWWPYHVPLFLSVMQHQSFKSLHYQYNSILSH